MTAATAATPIRDHLTAEHGYVAEALEGMDHAALVRTHEAQPHPHRHVQELEARTAQIALATSKESYEAACERFNAISEVHESRMRVLKEQMAGLDQEWNSAAAELRRHEDTAGIPLYNRCAACKPGRALPRNHAGPCR
jgi:hypothetical protein